MCMYADDSTLYMSATTATEITAILKELLLVSELMARNKLVLNISKTESIVFGTNHLLIPKPQLNNVMNNVEIEQVEVTKLLGVTMDCKLKMLMQQEKSVHSKALLCLLSNTINKAGPTGPSFVAPGLLFSSVVRCHKEGLCKGLWTLENCNWLRTGQHGWPLNVHSINNIHVNLSWLKVEERLTSSLLVFVRRVDKLITPSCLFILLAHSSDTHAYPTRHVTRGLFKIHKSRTNYGRRTVLDRALTTWNSIPHQITDASSRIRFKKQITKHLMKQQIL